MASPKGTKAAAAVGAVTSAISIAKITPVQARANFHAVLATNPNFFGNLPNSGFPPVLKIVGNTAYESLGCVGYNPQLKQLRATINIKLQSGYSGGLCGSGSVEYVRFYLSYDNGGTWQDQGLRSVNVFDVPGPKPLEYAVALNVNPIEQFCFLQNLPLVRAILSWNSPPPAGQPNFPPVWGNVVDAHIQVDGFYLIFLAELLKEAKLELPDVFTKVIDVNQPLKTLPKKSLTPVDLYRDYVKAQVPQHRFLAPAITALINAPSVADLALVQPPKTNFKVQSKFAGIDGIDVSALIEAYLNTLGNTTYEQLDCVGLDPAASQLVATVKVKQSSGYSGGPCSAGSQEYVAFWVDWGTGFEFAGLTSVTVHDFAPIPAGGLEYNVFLPVDLISHAQPCTAGPKTAKVRAVLSWQTPPSTTDPLASVTWGNALEGLILIPPGPVVGTLQIPVLSAVGDIEVSHIGADGRITSANAIQTGMHFANAPFGGRVTLAGAISNPTPGLKYRVMKAPHGSSSFSPVVNEPGGLTLVINDFNGVFWTQTDLTLHADPQGYYLYQASSVNHFVEGQLLGVWYTTAADSGSAFDLRVDLSVDGNPAHDVPSDVVTVLVNNDSPTAILTPSFGECGKMAPGSTITGVFTATASDFGSYNFTILPPGPAHGVLPVPPGATSNWLGGVVADPGVTGASFSLNTTGMDACGYSLTLNVWDRTNVNSGQGNNYAPASVGFCLDNVFAG